MATLKEQSERLRKINLRNIVNSILYFSDDILITLNQAQLHEGRNNLGNLIDRYRKNTIQYAKAAGIRDPERKSEGIEYDMEWTGRFFNEFKVKQIPDGVEITSNVPYLSAIQSLGQRNRAEGKLFGLTKEHIAEFNEKVLLPKIKEEVMKPNF